MNDNNTEKLIGALSSTQATLIAVNQKLGELNDEIKAWWADRQDFRLPTLCCLNPRGHKNVPTLPGFASQ